MRAIGHALLLFAFIAVAAAAIGFGFDWLETTDFLSNSKGVRSSRSTAYRAVSSGWLEFGLVEPGPIRILSNSAFRHLTDEPAHYAIDYELLDSSGQAVRSGRYHHRAQISLLHDPSSVIRELPIAKTIYSDTQLPGSNATEFWLEAPDLDLPARLRIRAAEHDDIIAEVSIRAYQRSELSPRKAKSAWQRLSRRKRDQLARGFAVPTSWLESFETTALARFTWRPLGPKGIKHEAYEERVLLIVNDPKLERARGDSWQVRTGVVDVWPELRTVIAMVRESESVKIRFAPRDGEETPAVLHVRVIPDTVYGEPREFDIEIAAQGTVVEETGIDGWIEFTSNRPLEGRIDRSAAKVMSGERDQHEPGIAIGRETASPIGLPRMLSTYDLDEEAWIEFEIEHVRSTATPIRVDVRALMMEAAPAEVGSAVEYALVDGDDRVIRSGTFPLPTERSVHDLSARFDPRQARLSEVGSHYFSVSREIEKLRLRSHPKAIVTVYSRPIDLVHPVRVPEDYRPVRIRRDRIPAWFSLRPNALDDLSAAGRVHRIRIQPRPRETESDIAAGQYDWESFQPHGDWVGRFLLAPREPGAPLRDAALSSTYLAVPANSAKTLDFSSTRGRRRLEPVLIFLREHSDVTSVRVEIDGKLAVDESILGRRGSLSLPLMATGRHRLEIQSSSKTRWFISHVRGDGDRLASQFAARVVGNGSLDFEFVKHDAEELLTLFVRSASDGENHARVRVRVIADAPALSTPLTGWTLRDRTFEVTGVGEKNVVVLETESESTQSGQRLFLPLASDLAPGDYRIRVDVEAVGDSYLSLYRVRTGSPTVRRIHREEAS